MPKEESQKLTPFFFLVADIMYLGRKIEEPLNQH